MKAKPQIVTLSAKYQVVIPREARKKLGVQHAAGQRFRVTKVTETEIVFSKDKNLEDFLGAYGGSFPADAATALRQQRQEWDK